METEKKRAVFHIPDYDGDNREFLNSRKEYDILKDYPDAVKHKILSFIKSGIRILACTLGAVGHFQIAFLGLAVAELVGIIEELV